VFLDFCLCEVGNMHDIASLEMEDAYVPMKLLATPRA
jgi:hypothetical protein